MQLSYMGQSCGVRKNPGFVGKTWHHLRGFPGGLTFDIHDINAWSVLIYNYQYNVALKATYTAVEVQHFSQSLSTSSRLQSLIKIQPPPF